MDNSKISTIVLYSILFMLLSVYARFAYGEATATITLNDSSIQIIRKTSLLKAKLGVALQKGDIVETGISNTQIEVSPNMILAFAPESKAHLASVEKSGAICTEVIVINGWVKAFTQKASADGCIKITSPLIGVLLENGASIVHVSDNKTDMFAEDSGQTITALGERGKAGAETKISREQATAQ